MKRFLPVLWAVLVWQPLSAQEKEEDFLRFYDNELFRWDFTMNGGPTLNFRQQTSSTFFGVSPMVNEALSSYPDTKAYADSYAKLNRSSNILMLGGVALMLAGCLVPVIMDDMGSVPDDRVPLSGKIMLGSFTVSMLATLTGGFLSSVGTEKIFQAVNMYNRHKAAEYQGSQD